MMPDFAVPADMAQAVNVTAAELVKNMQPLQRDGLRLVVQKFVADGAKGQNTIPAATGVDVVAGAARTFQIADVADAGLEVTSAPGPVAAILRVPGPNGPRPGPAHDAAPA